MPITPDEDKKFVAFIEEQAKALKSLEVAPNEVIWHYTTGDALLSIVNSEKSTQPKFPASTTVPKYATA